MKFQISKRNAIRIGSYLTALTVVLGAGAAVEYTRAQQYKHQLESSYMRSLGELSSYMASISTTLNKGIYAGTPTQLSTLSAQLWREAGSAKAALSSLPITQLELTNTYKFLSQVGDYAMTLSVRNAQGEAVTQGEMDNLTALLDYAGKMNQHISSLQQQISRGELTFDEIVQAAAQNQDGADTQQSPSDGTDGSQNDQLLSFNEMEDSFTGYPKLIYDGPFSDHMLERQPLLTQGQPEISQEEAQNRAAGATGISAGSLTFSGEENSNMASYCFSGENYDIGITKQGGYLAYLECAREIGDRALTNEQAVEKARAWLEGMGISSMKESYYESAGGVCTVNFAYTQEDVTCYTDLIKVGVALDNGQVVSVDARGYITNHHQREMAAPALTQQEALASVSSSLSAQGTGLALIPTAGLNEVLTYEFRCTSERGDNVLVYINAQTGEEEQILLLIETEDGVLTL